MVSIFNVSYYIFVNANTSKSIRVSKSIWSRYHTRKYKSPLQKQGGFVFTALRLSGITRHFALRAKLRNVLSLAPL